MLKPSKFSRWSCCFAAAFTFCLLGFIGAVSCDAQEEVAPTGGRQYKQLEVTEKLRKDRSEISGMLRNGIPASSVTKFETYYKDYIFPQWTVAKNYPNLPSWRKSLQTDFVSARDGESFKRLLDLSLTNLTSLATLPDYHPAVRFNAAVMLGSLNAKHPQSGASPEAYPNSLPVLLTLLEKEDEIDAARYGALLGVVRHAEFNVDAASRPKIIDALVKEASTQNPPLARSTAGHQWFRTTAIEGLGFARGEEVSKVAPVLAKIVNNSTESVPLRLAAANSLGKLTLTADSGADPAVTTRSLAELASDAVRQEVEAWENDKTKTINPALLKSRLLPIRVALSGQDLNASSPKKGLVAAVADNDKELLKKVWKPIGEWYGKLDDKNLVSTETDTTDPFGTQVPGADQKTQAQVATEELIGYFKMELQKMDNLLGVGGAGTQ